MTIRTALVTLLAIALFAWYLSRSNLSAVATEIARTAGDVRKDVRVFEYGD